MEGTVKFYNFKKRYGFITGEDGKDYFVHESGMQSVADVKEGTKVEFDLIEDDRGPKATNVKKVD